MSSAVWNPSPQHQALLRLEAMLDVLSHDLQSPLVGTRGFLEETRHTLATPETPTPTSTEACVLLNEVHEGLRRLETLAAGALREARRRRRPLQTIRVSPGDLLRHIAAEQSVHVDYPRAPLPDCLADPLRLQVALADIIAHACEMTPTVAFRASGHVHGQRAVFVIHDDAIYTRRAAAIELFWRPEGGGLAIARHLLIQQRGWLETLEDLDGRGGYRFWLPAVAETP